MKEFVNPKGVCHFDGMSHYCKIGNMIIIAGQIPVNEKGELIGAGDPAAQAEQVFSNIGKILDDCGAKVTDIVKLCTYLVNYDDRGPTKVVRQNFLKGHSPVTTSFTVKCLASPDFLIEVEAVVVLDD